MALNDIGIQRKFISNIKFPDDVFKVLITSTILILIKNLIVTPFARFLIYETNCLKKIKYGREKKFRLCLWRFVFYSGISLYGYYVLINEYWVRDISKYFDTWDRPYDSKILTYYYIEFSYYLTEFFFLFSEHCYNDIRQLLFHHTVTMFLIFFSYHNDFLRYGITVMGLHDISDPFLEISKLIKYSKNEKYLNILFGIFTIMFIFLRLFIYPLYIVGPALYYGFMYYDGIAAKFLASLLASLLIVHIIWLKEIIHAISEAIKGKGLSDTRSIHNQS